MEDCLKMCSLQTCQISNQYNNVWEWLKLSAGHITLPTAKKAPSHGNFSKILSEYGAHVQGLTAVKRTEIFFVWLKLYACHITLASQISHLLINIFKYSRKQEIQENKKLISTDYIYNISSLVLKK